MEVIRFWNWIAVGALSVCTAFILFLPGLNYGKELWVTFSLRLFLCAIPFLIAAIVSYKTILLERDLEEGGRSSHVKLAGTGALLTMNAFLVFVASLGWIELGSFVGTMIVALCILKKNNGCR